MTAASIRRLFLYNAWANRRMLDALAAVPAEAYLADRKSSHGGLHGTMLHVIWAHHLWLLRWLGRPADEAVEWKKGAVSLADLRSGWNTLESRTNAFLDERLTVSFPGETFTMHTTKGERFVHTYAETMLHLVMHSALHRGQVGAMLRQAGFVPPGTDFIMFAREHPDQAASQ